MKRVLFTLAATVAVAGAAVAGPGHDHDHANPLVHAPEQVEVGKLAPDFTLVDTDGNEHTLSDYVADGKIVVLEWFNPGCPFVVRHHVTHTTMDDLYTEFSDENVVFLAINSTNKNHRDYGVDVELCEKWGKKAPSLRDEDGKVGRMYGAKTTPHMFIVDSKGVLAYNGTWWPLIVVGAIAGSALVVSVMAALFVKARSGPRKFAAPAAAKVGRDAPPPRAGGQVGRRGRGNKKKRKRRR